MASAYQKRRTWYARYRDETGAWTAMATAATTKTEAKRIASDLERQYERVRLGLEPMPVGTTMTLTELCSWWLRERCPAPSVEKERSRIRHAILDDAIGALPLVRAGPLLDARFRELERGGASAGTLNRLRATLHSAFKQGATAGYWRGPNPVDAVPLRRVVKQAYETLRAEEVGVLLAHVPNNWRPLFATALYAGLRRGELFALRKSDVDLEHRTLLVAGSHDRDTTKGGHHDVLPIAAPLVPYLETALASSETELLFPRSDGERHSVHVHMPKILRRALVRAGFIVGWEHVCRRCKAGRKSQHTWRFADAAERRCPSCEMVLWPRALPRPMRFHDLRHSTATLLMRAAVDVHRVQRIMRHRDVRTTVNVYGHLDVEDLRDGIGKLPAASNVVPFVTRLLPAGPAAKKRGRTRGKIPNESGL